MDDYTNAWLEMTALPPRHLPHGATADALIATIRADYGLTPGQPVLSSERPPPRYRPPAVSVDWNSPR